MPSALERLQAARPAGGQEPAPTTAPTSTLERLQAVRVEPQRGHRPSLRGPSAGAAFDPRTAQIDQQREALGVDITRPPPVTGHGTQGTPKDLSGTVLETVGAVSGAAIGGRIGGGLFGAIALGAGGARAGHALNDWLWGDPSDKGEMDAAGMIGAAGPLAGRTLQFASRFMAEVPLLRSAPVKQAARAARRTSAAARGRELDKQLADMQYKYDQMAGHKLGEQFAIKDRAGKQVGTITVDENFLKMTARTRAEIKKYGLDNKEAAVARVRSMVQAGKFPEGTMETAVGVALGGYALGLEYVWATGAVGFILGRVRGRVAERLANRPEFIRWATGLRNQTLTDAISTYTTEVLAREASQAEDSPAWIFFKKLVALTAGTIAGGVVGGQVADAAGDAVGAVVGVGAGYATKEGTELALEALKAGKEELDQFLGRGTPKGPLPHPGQMLDFRSPIQIPRAKPEAAEKELELEARSRAHELARQIDPGLSVQEQRRARELLDAMKRIKNRDELDRINRQFEEMMRTAPKPGQTDIGFSSGVQLPADGR